MAIGIQTCKNVQLRLFRDVFTHFCFMNGHFCNYKMWGCRLYLFSNVHVSSHSCFKLLRGGRMWRYSMYIQYTRYFVLVTLFWSYKWNECYEAIYLYNPHNQQQLELSTHKRSQLSRGLFILVIYVICYVYDTLINKHQDLSFWPKLTFKILLFFLLPYRYKSIHPPVVLTSCTKITPHS